MAYISGKYTSATEYSITLGGMAIGTVYAILVQDLNSDGSSNGFVCKWKSGATSSTTTVKYTTSSTYSRYDRKIGFFQGTFNTSVGTHITDAQFNSWADGTGTISAWGGGGSTGYILQVASDGWPSILHSVKVTSGTFTSSNNAINYSTRQYITQINLTGTAINNRWTGNIYWKNASGSRFLVATVTNGSVSLASSIEPIDCTGNRTISFVAEGSYNTGTRVYLRCGIGISSYIVQYTDYDGIVTNKTISSTSNTYIDVKENSTIYASSPNYVTDYEGPYHFQQWSTDFGSVTTENIGTDVTVGSTSLYLKLVGVHRPWEVTYDANGGTWTSSVTNPELVEYLGKASIADYSLAVSRKNYKLLGWFTSATGGTQWAATNIVQQDMTLYAHWELTIATITLYGNGGLWGGNLQYRSFEKEVGDIINLADYGPNGTPPLGRAYYSLVGWSTSSTGTAAWDVNGTITVGATDASYYAVWEPHIELFYWDGDTGSADSSIIAKGLPVTNLTASRWNRFKKKINEITQAQTGKAWSYTTTYPGDSITAIEVLNARNAIAALNGNVPLPTATQLATGKKILASYFNGKGSLKDALNIVISNYNKTHKGAD